MHTQKHSALFIENCKSVIIGEAMSNNFDFNEIISNTENLIKSGKWEELNALASALYETVNQEDEWLATVLTSLHYRNCLEYKKLNLVLKRQDDILAEAAWHTRNLLELFIWITYCCENKENAYIFYGDAARDTFDILNTFQKWSSITGLYPQDKEKYDAALKNLEKSANKKNVYDLDKSYKKIRKVAESVGLGLLFSTLNKGLSKFIHPTAYSIISNWEEDSSQKTKNVFYGQSCLLFSLGFNLLEEAMRKLYEASTSR